MEAHYYLWDKTFPVSTNGVSVPISTKWFRLSHWPQFEEKIKKEVLACLWDEFYWEVRVPYHVPSVRKNANRAMLYLLGTQNPAFADIHVTLFTWDTSGEFLQDTWASGFPRDPSDLLEIDWDNNHTSNNQIFGEIH